MFSCFDVAPVARILWAFTNINICAIMPPDENEEVPTMQRGQRRSPQPSRPGQPRRAPQRRPATYRRRRRRSKHSVLYVVAAVIFAVALILMISAAMLNSRNDKQADDVRSENQIESARSENPELKFGELLDVTETSLTDNTVCVVKVKISPSYSNKATVDQNYFNIEYLIKNCGFDKYDELQYWAVADMTDGGESKVFSCTVGKTLMSLILNGSVSASEYGAYVGDLWILPSLT